MARAPVICITGGPAGLHRIFLILVNVWGEALRCAQCFLGKLGGPSKSKSEIQGLLLPLSRSKSSKEGSSSN